MQNLSKRDQKQLRQCASRHGRHKHGLSLCEGVRCVAELLDKRPQWVQFVVAVDDGSADARLAPLLAICRQRNLPVAMVGEQEFKNYAETANPQGILTLFRPVMTSADAIAQSERPPLALVLDRIAEPGNMGTILRTAWAVGLKIVWLTDGCADPYSPKAIRAGMGAQFALDLVHGNSLPALRINLRAIGYDRMWLSMPRGGVACCDDAFQLHNAAVVIGNEANGVTVLEDADIVSIPMPGDAESLNASQAATILLYEAVRRGLRDRKLLCRSD